jgi:hypothetical protein
MIGILEELDELFEAILRYVLESLAQACAVIYKAITNHASSYAASKEFQTTLRGFRSASADSGLQ